MSDGGEASNDVSGTRIETHGDAEWIVSWVGAIGSAKPADREDDRRVDVVGNLISTSGTVPRTLVESIFEKGSGPASRHAVALHGIVHEALDAHQEEQDLAMKEGRHLGHRRK